MPEGHTLHRIARQHTALLKGRRIEASSPQGRFVAGAQRLDGATIKSVSAYGKHLFYVADGIGEQLHIHLGLYGKFANGPLPAPEPRGALRLRMCSDETWIDLRGATACELLEPRAVEAILDRLGPDPLARRPDPDRAWQRLSRSRAPIATALMDQSVIAGIGNVYRAELLFRHRRDPFKPSKSLDHFTWLEMWDDIVTLMRSGVRSGRIVTTQPVDRERPTGRVARDDASYVYRRHGLPCRVCGTIVLKAEHVGRNLYWCPFCQVE